MSAEIRTQFDIDKANHMANMSLTSATSMALYALAVQRVLFGCAAFIAADNVAMIVHALK